MSIQVHSFKKLEPMPGIAPPLAPLVPLPLVPLDTAWVTLDTAWELLPPVVLSSALSCIAAPHSCASRVRSLALRKVCCCSSDWTCRVGVADGEHGVR